MTQTTLSSPISQETSNFSDIPSAEKQNNKTKLLAKAQTKHMDNLDILNELNDVNLSDVDTNFPVLPKSPYKVLISNVEVKESKGDKGGNYLEVKMTLNQDGVKSTKQVPVAAGFPLTMRIGLTPTEKYPQDTIKRNLAQFLDGTIGESARKSGQGLTPLEKFTGIEATARVSISTKDVEQYGERNEVNGLLKKD
jgi:hypothetical protein